MDIGATPHHEVYLTVSFNQRTMQEATALEKALLFKIAALAGKINRSKNAANRARKYFQPRNTYNRPHRVSPKLTAKPPLCKKFLNGTCDDENCTLRHKVKKNGQVPVCSFFLRGVCTRTNCPYSHVRVNPDAEVCPDFLKGYCPLGEQCKLLHMKKKVNICPDFLKGYCAYGEQCKFLHEKSSNKRKQTNQLSSNKSKMFKETHEEQSPPSTSTSSSSTSTTSSSSSTEEPSPSLTPSFVSLSNTNHSNFESSLKPNFLHLKSVGNGS